MATDSSKTPGQKSAEKTVSRRAVRGRKSIGSSDQAGEMEEELRKIKEQLSVVENLTTEIQELRAKQEKYNEMEEELKILRAKCDEGSERGRCMRGDRNCEQSGGIANLLVDVQKLNIEIRLPKFSDEDARHPIEYIRDLENYFKVRNMTDSAKLLVIENSLENKAKYWFENNKLEIATFDVFKEKFKKAFFSIPMQMKIKEKWQARIYESGKSLEIFFSEQLRIARYFEPRM